MFEGVHERVHNRWIEIRPGAGDDHLLGFKRSDCPAIGAVAGLGVECIGDRQYSGFERNLIPLGGTISRPIELVMMRKNNGSTRRNDPPTGSSNATLFCTCLRIS